MKPWSSILDGRGGEKGEVSLLLLHSNYNVSPNCYRSYLRTIIATDGPTGVTSRPSASPGGQVSLYF